VKTHLPDWFCSRVSSFDPHSCWVWTGYKTKAGYGQLPRRVGSTSYAHRFSYTSLVGPIPPGMTVDHLCKCTSCVNPAHMEVVTRGENAKRGGSPHSVNSRKTHCSHGHELAGENVYLTPDGRRKCRECGRTAARIYQRQKRSINA